MLWAVVFLGTLGPVIHTDFLARVPPTLTVFKTMFTPAWEQ